jgi:hypothetical protein
MQLTGGAVAGRKKKGLARVRELGLEVVVALAVVVVVFYAAVRSGLPEGMFFRWLGLAGATALAFGYPLRWSRRLWHRPRFWGAWVGLLFLHLAAYIAVLLSVSHFGFLWFAIITPAEWGVICPILDRAGRSGPGGPR